MPIQFRCNNCDQMLSITRRKAGRAVTCPACRKKTQVPDLEEAYVAGQLLEAVEEPPAADTPPETPPPPAPARSAEPAPPPPPSPAPAVEDAAAQESPAAEPASLTTPVGLAGSEDDEDGERGFRLSRRVSADDELDMTPMVDVTFLLLIFFMITASFSLQKSMESEAPEPEQEGASQLPMLEDFADDSVIVEIDENDALFVDDQPVAGLGELEDVLLQKLNGEQKTEMVIEPHYQATHGMVVQVTDAGVHAGMQRIRRVTRGAGE